MISANHAALTAVALAAILIGLAVTQFVGVSECNIPQPPSKHGIVALPDPPNGQSSDTHTCEHVMSYNPFGMTYEQCLGRVKNVNMLCELLAEEQVPSVTTQEEAEKYNNIITVCPIGMMLNYPITIHDGIIEVEMP